MFNLQFKHSEDVSEISATGNDYINQPLSEKRADRAKQYIISKGIDASRIIAEGHGSSNPIADNKTQKGKAKNRRVEITVQ